MTAAEWESLCDGCGLCCLVRFEDEDTGEIIPTRVACRLFDAETCRCTDYADRQRHVPDCIKLTPRQHREPDVDAAQLRLPPPARGRPCRDWHPLVTGDPESVHRAGVSVRGQTISETVLTEPEDALDFAAPDC